MKSGLIIIIALLALGFCAAPYADAAGKKKKASPPASTAPFTGKRVLAIAPVEKVRIELPDNQFRDFGDDFLAKLRTRFTQGKEFVVIDPVDPEPSAKAFSLSAKSSDGFEWESNPVPAATVRINVNALSFVTGARGGRMFYGFDERFRNSFNDGSGARLNEFPVNTDATGKNQASWFDGTFAPIGKQPFDSLSGLDLGDGFGIDVLFAWLRVKYAKYRAELRLTMEIDAPVAGKLETRSISVNSKGFFYDVAGAYAQWDGAIRIARRDAMLKAFNRAFDEASAQIQKNVGALPLTARIDAIGEDGEIFLGTGRSAQIPVGTRYMALEDPSIQLEVSESFQAGSLARLSSGGFERIYPGMIFREYSAEYLAKSAARMTAHGSNISAKGVEGIIIDLPTENIPAPAFGKSVKEISRTRAFVLSLLETIFLPYRIWRYYQYDRSYKAHADDFFDSVGNESKAASLREWAESARREPWAAQIGLTQVPLASERAPVIAVIDSGMDYNHAVLHDSLWLNPVATGDAAGRQDRYGWDFISGDSRPYDDGYHGTRVSSAILAVAPSARIMPLKVFNPWGVTNSASLYAAFEYALANGAEMIVCPWSTRFHSEAIEKGIALAAKVNVPVVAAAGDLGRDLRIAHAYPAALAPKYPNLIIVTAVDSSNKPLRISNAHPRDVHLAAPGANVLVAEPRNLETRAHSTGIAAAIAAGALARKMAAYAPEDAAALDWRRELQASADRVPSLAAYAQDGLRLRVDR